MEGRTSCARTACVCGPRESTAAECWQLAGPRYRQLIILCTVVCWSSVDHGHDKGAVKCWLRLNGCTIAICKKMDMLLCGKAKTSGLEEEEQKVAANVHERWRSSKVCCG